jgi:hypothetical protein
MTQNPQPNGMEAMQSPEQLSNPPAEMLPENAVPGVPMASPESAGGQ